jgi:Tfp pilus assembly protein PilO
MRRDWNLTLSVICLLIVLKIQAFAWDGASSFRRELENLKARAATEQERELLGTEVFVTVPLRVPVTG